MKRFPFKNNNRLDLSLIEAAFEDHGMTVAEVEYKGRYKAQTFVLTTDGQLWLLDLSHDGGGCFELV